MAEPIDEHFITTITAMADTAPPRPSHDQPDDSAPLSAPDLLDLFDSQIGSRHLDLAARWLRAHGKGFYTIGSSGHESNAAVAAALRPDDPALLHYRSGAFFLQRARQVGGSDPLRDVLLGVVAATEDPISGGRHKVFGRHDLHIIPQTSTIASHLPRAVGVAFSIARAAKLGVSSRWPSDAIAICSFGDASVNHSTAVGAINTAIHAAYQGLPLPLLFVCEDNGIGISTRTPKGWITANYGNRHGLTYASADGRDLPAVYTAASSAAEWVRNHRKPAFLHLHMVRLMGHAGSDVESAYRATAEVSAEYDRDPVLCTAKMLIERGLMSPSDVLDRYEHKRTEVISLARQVSDLPQLDSARAVMKPLREARREAAKATRTTREPARGGASAAGGTADGGPLTLAQAINRALLDVLTDYPEALVFGEDVARKGGVYGVTRGLMKKFGPARVFDTLLDEQAILGLALGAGTSGLLPIPEIQYLAYLHNAADQIRGEGATLQFFSNRQYRNPMIVRIAGYGYQKGFGGHFHNDNAIGALRDIPGLIIASPSRPHDAAAMMHTCAAAARSAGALCVYLEPIALYHTRDVYKDGDEQWLARYPDSRSDQVPLGHARTYHDGTDLTMVTFGNGVHMSLRVARRLRRAHISTRVVDMRWLSPLPVKDILREANATGRVLVVDETRASGGVAEGVISALVDEGFTGSLARVTSKDSFIPLGDAALKVLLDEDTIEAAAMKLAEVNR